MSQYQRRLASGAKPFTVWLDTAERDAVKTLASRFGVTQGEAVLMAVYEALDRPESPAWICVGCGNGYTRAVIACPQCGRSRALDVVGV